MLARISITYGWVKNIGDSSALAAMIGLSRRRSTSKPGSGIVLEAAAWTLDAA